MVGVGHPVEVSYALPGAIPAGAWRIVGDGIIVAAPTVAFDLALRRGGAADAPIVSFQHAYPMGMTAQYEETKTVPAVAAVAGDRLVLKVSLVGVDPNAEYIPFSEQPPTPTARFLSVDVP